MLRKPRRVEWFVILAIIVALSALLREEYVNWRERRRYHERIDAFDAQSVQPLLLPAKRIVADETLSGRWVTRGRRHGSLLVFTRMEGANDSQYQIQFATHTCTAYHNEERTADCRDGRISLNKPVAEALGPVYQQLYCARVGTKRLLIPQARSEDMARLLAAIDNAESRNQWHDLQELAYLYEDGEGD